MSSEAKVRVAALQMVSTPRVADNLATAAGLIAEAAALGAQLLALPEYFSCMGHKEDALQGEAEGCGPVQDFLSAMARQHGLWLIGGTLSLTASVPGKVRNSCLVYDPQGQRVARYDKIHLFSLSKNGEHYDESTLIEPGHQPVALTTPFGRIGLGICYALRFPALYRRLGARDLLVIPAAFTAQTGQAHWEVLLRARAIENQCYVLASAQGGRHENGRETYGNSLLIDPWGRILARCDKGAGVVSGELDAAYLAEVRSSLPALAHRVL